MHQDDLAQFAALLVVTGELYNKTIPDYLTDIYWEALQKFTLIEIKQAFKSHIHKPNGGQFFPKPADLIKLITKNKTNSTQAWSTVEYAVTTAGIYRSVKFNDPLIHATIQCMGGWIKICSTPLKDWSWLAHEFQRKYEELESYPPFAAPQYCYGLIEIMNTNQGYTSEPPVLINNLPTTLLINCLT